MLFEFTTLLLVSTVLRTSALTTYLIQCCQIYRHLYDKFWLWIFQNYHFSVSPHLRCSFCAVFSNASHTHTTSAPLADRSVHSTRKTNGCLHFMTRFFTFPNIIFPLTYHTDATRTHAHFFIFAFEFRVKFIVNSFSMSIQIFNDLLMCFTQLQLNEDICIQEKLTIKLLVTFVKALARKNTCITLTENYKLQQKPILINTGNVRLSNFNFQSVS